MYAGDVRCFGLQLPLSCTSHPSYAYRCALVGRLITPLFLSFLWLGRFSIGVHGQLLSFTWNFHLKPAFESRGDLVSAATISPGTFSPDETHNSPNSNIIKHKHTYTCNQAIQNLHFVQTLWFKRDHNPALDICAELFALIFTL